MTSSTAVRPPHTDGVARVRARRSKALVASVVLGLALIAAPFAFQMFDRAPKGATMIAEFKPFMTSQRLAGFHTDMATIRAAVAAVDAAHPSAAADPTYRDFDAQWPQIDRTMTGLLDKVTANQRNYQAVAAMPDFRLFPWFFVIPGALIAVAAGVALLRPGARRPVRGVLAVLGVGLVLAPVLFGMFARAPKGGHMMAAFKDIETMQQVAQIQGYFATMAAGQGAIRLTVAPALAHTGNVLPAVEALDRNWVHVLNDMTPMVGVMSDNVVNYQAVAALPPFALFPWFFVIPGVFAVALAVSVRTKPEGVS